MQQQVPFLITLRTAKDVAAAAERKAQASGNLYAHEAAAYMLLRAGEVLAATQALHHILTLRDVGVPWQQNIASRAGVLQAALRDGEKDAVQLLGTWESETVRKLGLERFRK